MVEIKQAVQSFLTRILGKEIGSYTQLYSGHEIASFALKLDDEIFKPLFESKDPYLKLCETTIIPGTDASEEWIEFNTILKRNFGRIFECQFKYFEKIAPENEDFTQNIVNDLKRETIEGILINNHEVLQNLIQTIILMTIQYAINNFDGLVTEQELNELEEIFRADGISQAEFTGVLTKPYYSSSYDTESNSDPDKVRMETNLADESPSNMAPVKSRDFACSFNRLDVAESNVLSDMRDTRAVLKSQCDKFDTENYKLRNMNELLEKDKENFQQKMSEEMDELNLQVYKLKEKQDLDHKKILWLECENTKLTTENEKQNAKIIKILEDSVELEKRDDKNRDELEARNERLDKYKVTVSDLNSKIQNLLTENQKVAAHARECHKKLDKAEKLLPAFKSENQKFNDQNDKQMNLMKTFQDQENFAEMLQILDKDDSKSNDELNDFFINQFNKMITKEKSQNNQKSLEEANDNIHSLEMLQQQWKDQLEQKDSQIKTLINDLEGFKDEVQAIKQNNVKVNTLVNDNKDLEVLLTSKIDEIHLLQNKNTKKNSQIAERNSEIKNLLSDNEKLDSKCHENKNKLKFFEDANENIKNQLQMKQAEVDQLNNDYASLFKEHEKNKLDELSALGSIIYHEKAEIPQKYAEHCGVCIQSKKNSQKENQAPSHPNIPKPNPQKGLGVGISTKILDKNSNNPSKNLIRNVKND